MPESVKDLLVFRLNSNTYKGDTLQGGIFRGYNLQSKPICQNVFLLVEPFLNFERIAYRKKGGQFM